MTGYPGMDYRKEPKLAPLYDWSTEFESLKDKPKYVSLEGYLFPNTYRFAADATAKDVVRKLLKEFEKQTDGIFQDELKESGKIVLQERKGLRVLVDLSKQDKSEAITILEGVLAQLKE